MNQLRIAGCVSESLDVAGEQILDRSLLWEQDAGNLWIKNHQELMGIGGNIKQNKLIAGDNIEILEDDERFEGVSWLHPMIRVKDNIKVHTATLSPGTEEDPIIEWKGTIFLGELKDGNLVYLITKATEVRDEDQALFGGQILVKMITKDGKEIYSQYAVTITSTGSWSLWGGNTSGTNIRVCKAKYKGEWYYGLKIPSGEFLNVKTVDSPDIEAQNKNTRTYLQMGSIDSEYKFYVGAAMKSEIPLIPTTELVPDDDGIITGDYTLSIKKLVDNLGWDVVATENAEDNLWKKWYADDENIVFNISNYPVAASAWKEYGKSDTIYLYRAGDVNNQSANYQLRTYYTNNWGGQSTRSVTLTDSGTNHLMSQYDDTTWEFDTAISELASSGNHYGYPFTSGLRIITKAPSTYNYNRSLAGNVGYISFSKDSEGNLGNFLELPILGPCTITIHGRSNAAEAVRLRVISKEDGVTSEAFDTTGVSTLVYEKTSVAPEKLILSADDAISIASISIAYDKTVLTYQNSNYVAGEKLAGGYNHWYYMTVGEFQNLLGMTFQGEWAKYASNNRYRIYFRIYTKVQNNNTESWTRINCIQIRDMNSTDVYTDRMDGKYGEVLVDFDATELDPPFTWQSILMNLKGDGYEYGERYVNMKASGQQEIAIGTFNDREPNTVNYFAEMVKVNSITYPDTLDSTVGHTLFDQQYLVDNYETIIAWTSNSVPLFSQYATLYYDNQEGVDRVTSYTFFADFQAHYNEIVGHHYKDVYFTDNLDIERTELWYNGWYDLPEPLIPPQPPTSELEFQVLARESQDEDSFSEVFFTSEAIPVVVRRIDELQEIGEDAPPYKWVITNRVLSMSDLKLLAAHVRTANRQIWLDLSGCSVATDAEDWNESIFEGCSSLRGLIIPTGVKTITNGCFIWCTYMRELDLTPSASTLYKIGGGTGWATSMGTLTSTRIRTVILPKNVTRLDNYQVYSSNVVNYIMLYTDASAKNLNFKDWTNGWTNEWAWCGIAANGAKLTTLPTDFHLFMDQSFWDAPEFVIGRTVSGNVWYGTSTTHWTNEVKESVVLFDYTWTKAEWQDFNNEYHWGEELINRVRREFDPDCSDFEIIDYTFMQ